MTQLIHLELFTDFFNKIDPEPTSGERNPDCILPTDLASVFNAVLEKDRDRCLQEVNAGLR